MSFWLPIVKEVAIVSLPHVYVVGLWIGHRSNTIDNANTIDNIEITILNFLLIY